MPLIQYLSIHLFDIFQYLSINLLISFSIFRSIFGYLSVSFDLFYRITGLSIIYSPIYYQILQLVLGQSFALFLLFIFAPVHLVSSLYFFSICFVLFFYFIVFSVLSSCYKLSDARQLRHVLRPRIKIPPSLPSLWRSCLSKLQNQFAQYLP